MVLGDAFGFSSGGFVCTFRVFLVVLGIRKLDSDLQSSKKGLVQLVEQCNDLKKGREEFEEMGRYTDNDPATLEAMKNTTEAACTVANSFECCLLICTTTCDSHISSDHAITSHSSTLQGSFKNGSWGTYVEGIKEEVVLSLAHALSLIIEEDLSYRKLMTKIKKQTTSTKNPGFRIKADNHIIQKGRIYKVFIGQVGHIEAYGKDGGLLEEQGYQSFTWAIFRPSLETCDFEANVDHKKNAHGDSNAKDNLILGKIKLSKLNNLGQHLVRKWTSRSITIRVSIKTPHIGRLTSIFSVLGLYPQLATTVLTVSLYLLNPSAQNCVSLFVFSEIAIFWQNSFMVIPKLSIANFPKLACLYCYRNPDTVINPNTLWARRIFGLPRNFDLLSKPLNSLGMIRVSSMCTNVGEMMPDAGKLYRIVIDEWLLCRRMERSLDQIGIGLTTPLVVDILNRLHYEEKLAFRFFAWAGQEDNYSHEPRAYNDMIEILSSTKYKVKQFRIVCDLLDYMKRHNMNPVLLVEEAEVLFARVKNRIKPDANTYNILFSGWCRVRDPGKGMGVLDEMIKLGQTPDNFTYNPAIDAFCKIGMSSPTTKTYAIMITALAWSDRIEECFKVVKDMIDGGCLPDVSTYKQVIEGMSRAGKIEEAYKFFEEMGRKGYPPDIVTYNCFLKVLCDNKKSEEAHRLYKRMIEVDCLPSVHTYNIVISMFFAMSDPEGALETWHDMNKRPCRQDSDTYCVMNEGLFGFGRAKDACAFIKDVIDKSIKLPYRKFDAFLMDLSTIGDLQAIHQLSEHMRKFYNPAMARRFALNQKRKSMSLRGK
ncbi:Pentatricopeptide repeat [Dillenia turbinata]|uniref:Pentatricopeptide repeat n=1 Tax=Dillenia turbinata TaxID=194707 RepID=A0AAN8Z9H2_9MAGN